MLGCRCVYDSLGYAKTDVQRALARVENAGVVYFVNGSVQNLSHFRFWLSGARPWLTR
jgi:hypothetical protein